MAQYLWFDCETGGTDPNVHSLLTAYFAVVDEDLNFIDDLYLQLKPQDVAKIIVTKEAMNVNGIDLEEHLIDPATITYEEGRVVLKDFLEKYKIKGKRHSFIPAGHNVQFDKDMIWTQVMPKEDWGKLVHYRTIDTFAICAFMKAIGFFPNDVDSLTSLVEYYKIPMKEAHNAKGDVQMNIEVFRSMVNAFKVRKDQYAGIVSGSLLEIVEE